MKANRSRKEISIPDPEIEICLEGEKRRKENSIVIFHSTMSNHKKSWNFK